MKVFNHITRIANSSVFCFRSQLLEYTFMRNVKYENQGSLVSEAWPLFMRATALGVLHVALY